MKKIITSVVALLVMGSVSFAQDAAKPAKAKMPAKAKTTAAAPKAESKMAPKAAAPKASTKKKTAATK